jgi:nitroreductase
MLKLLADDAIVRRIGEAAGAAPSIHNTQPWRLSVGTEDLLELRADPDRALWVADPHARGLYLSCGAALFNIRTAIRMAGHNPLVWPFPQPTYPPMVLAIVQAELARPPSLAERELFDAIWQRHTDRGPFAERPVPESAQIALEQAAGYEFGTLRMLSTREVVSVLDLAASADRAMAADFDHQVELEQWIATDSHHDGIPAAALPPRPDHSPAPVRDFASVAPTVGRPSASYEQNPQLAVLTTACDEPADWLRAGQALQRVLLTATVHGVSASFLYQPIELHDMRGDAAPAWPWPEHPQMIIRFGYGSQSTGTPRRRPDEVFVQPAGRGARADG